MAAIIRDITIEQGGAIDEEFLLKANGVIFDLTGYTSTMIIKDHLGTTRRPLRTDRLLSTGLQVARVGRFLLRLQRQFRRLLSAMTGS